MSHAGAVLLCDLAGKLELLRVACKKCHRHGQYRVLRLIREHGAELGLPDFRAKITADCVESQTSDKTPRCGAYFPDLGGNQR